jgi:hypothetical protein
LVIGEGKGVCGSLVEPKSGVDEGKKGWVLVERIWGAAEEINGELPVHARVHGELVVVATIRHLYYYIVFLKLRLNLIL